VKRKAAGGLPASSWAGLLPLGGGITIASKKCPDWDGDGVRDGNGDGGGDGGGDGEGVGNGDGDGDEVGEGEAPGLGHRHLALDSGVENTGCDVDRVFSP